MNGRLYDPKLHRFLQPDNYVQDPYNTQNYNRYGYVLNNPLKYTDPSGELFWIPIIVGAVIGAYVGGSAANNDWNPANWDWSSGKTWKAIGLGAVVGAIAGEVLWAGITGVEAFGVFTVKLGFGIALPGIGTVGVYKLGQQIGTEYTNPNGETFNQKIGTVSTPKPKSDGKEVDPSTVAQNLPLFGGRSTYAGGNNPLDFDKNYTYSYVPTMITDYPAIGHDRRYDRLGIEGAGGLFLDTRAIGADWKFVSEQFQLTRKMKNPVDTYNSFILGIGLGAAATPKTIFQMLKPNGYAEMMMWYRYSNIGVDNKPRK